MADQIVVEMYVVKAASPEEAAEKARDSSANKKSVIYSASRLRDLAHPGHLADAETSFGSIGAVAEEPVDEDG